MSSVVAAAVPELRKRSHTPAAVGDKWEKTQLIEPHLDDHRPVEDLPGAGQLVIAFQIPQLSLLRVPGFEAPWQAAEKMIQTDQDASSAREDTIELNQEEWGLNQDGWGSN